MIYDKNILATRVTLSDYDLMVMDLEFIKKMVKEKISRGLAAEIEKKVELTERPNFELQAKEFEARVVVMNMEEYQELRAIIRSLEERVAELEDIEDTAYEVLDILSEKL